MAMGGVGSLLIGFGMGLARTVFIVGIQNSVEWKMRGVQRLPICL